MSNRTKRKVKNLTALFSAIILFAVIARTPGADPMNQPEPDYDALIAKAYEKGSLPIILTLRMDFMPEGSLPDREAVLQQREKIASLQKAILDRLERLGASPVSVKRFRAIPFLAMDIDAKVLAELITFTEVERVGEDKAEPLLDTM